MADDDAGAHAWGFARGVEGANPQLDALTEDSRMQVDALEPRLREILRLMVNGCGVEEMASQTGLSAAQVEAARNRLLGELGVGSTTDAIRIGICADYRQQADRSVSPD